jgi:hypothetical protein
MGECSSASLKNLLTSPLPTRSSEAGARVFDPSNLVPAAVHFNHTKEIH